jgi:CheY-like chemotaxis protein
MAAPTKLQQVRSVKDRRAVTRGGRRAGDAAAAAKALAESPATLNPADAPLVLVVDDFVDGREMVMEYLAFRGFRVVDAPNAAEAFEKATTLLPDIVLLDALLPDGDGLEIAARLRAGERTRHMKIAVCTAAVLTDMRTRARSARVNMFIPKPCNLAELALQLQFLMTQNPVESSE